YKMKGAGALRRGGGGQNNKKNTLGAKGGGLLRKLDPLKHILSGQKLQPKSTQNPMKRQKLPEPGAGRGDGGELEDVDDISIEEYKKSEINTLKRVRDHVLDHGDALDNFDILDDSQTVFTYASDDIASLEILGQDQQHLNRGGKRYQGLDADLDALENLQQQQAEQANNQQKMGRKEKARRKLEKKLHEAKMIHFKELPPFKRIFWRDTVHMSDEEQRAIRVRNKVRIEQTLLKNNSFEVSATTTETSTTTTTTTTTSENKEKEKDKEIVIPRPITAFNDRDLPNSMRAYIEFLTKKHQAIKEPTPVQMQCWSAILGGNDVLTIAQTGSGKTLGYLLPAIPHIMAQMKERQMRSKEKSVFRNIRSPIVLVIVPTRELAQQVESVCKPMKSKLGVHSIAVYGGIKAHGQKEILAEEHNEIMIATPGRLVDLIERSHEVAGLLSRVTMLVFDEADRMLQLGFGDQLQKISEQIRPDRQTLMFSATFPKAMQEAAAKWLNQPLKIRVKSSAANEENTSVITKNVRQVVRVVEGKDRFEHLSAFLQMVINKEQLLRNRSLILIFVNQIKNVKPLMNQIEKMLTNMRGAKRSTKVGCIFGDMKQEERDQSINDFKSGKINIMVATDILGRGIHINNLRFVINYDFPTSLEQYIHRVGRTGRQGNKGHSVTYFVASAQNTPMARGLIRILEECQQQVLPALTEVANNYFGPLAEMPDLRPEASKDDESDFSLEDDSDFDYDMKEDGDDDEDEDEDEDEGVDPNDDEEEDYEGEEEEVEDDDQDVDE
ncbi:hypothetical protein SAMD00019534_006730, partial [Acytostelium subglobosum LB1]|uniref:hypothetical protein n=1 Tax=Acytostelium subglobosum LB1 TaxID=1410327 RepID=UPI0006448632